MASSRAASRRAMIEKSTIQNLFSSNSMALIISRGGAVHSGATTALSAIGYWLSAIGYRLLIELAAERIGTMRDRARLLCSSERIVKSSRKRAIVAERSTRCGAFSGFFGVLTLA